VFDGQFESLVTTVLPGAFDIVLDYFSKYSDDCRTEHERDERSAARESLLGRTLDYACAAVSRPRHSDRLLNNTLRSICRVAESCLPPAHCLMTDPTVGSGEKGDLPPIDRQSKPTQRMKAKTKAKRTDEDETTMRRHLRRNCDQLLQRLLELGLLFLRQTSEIDLIDYLIGTSLPITLRSILTWGGHADTLGSEVSLSRHNSLLGLVNKVRAWRPAALERHTRWLNASNSTDAGACTGRGQHRR
jgi:hypothetical protein